MLNIIAIVIAVGFVFLVGAAYRQSKKTRQELIAEMKEEILSNEPAPIEPLPSKMEVKEMIAVQETKPKSKRKYYKKKKSTGESK